MNGLKGRFVKVLNPDGTQDFDNSFWEVSAENMFIFKITVQSLCVANPILDYKAIATQEFGYLLLRKAKKNKAFW